MSVLDLSRLQFATTAIAHFLFVVLTLGLAPMVAIMQTRWAITGKAVHEKMTRFWGQLYIVNYAMGIVVGLVLEFQFGLHWSGLMEFAGDVFGPVLATETLVAFFLESTFLGMWIFGWNRLNKWVHTALIWLVVITGYLSAFWVMVANGFLQEPVGHVIEDGVVQIDDVGALLTNQQAIGALLHILPACLLTASVVMVGICSWHFLRATPDLDLFRRSLRMAVIVGAIGAVFTIGNGFAQFGYLVEGKELFLQGDQAALAAYQARMEAVHGPGDWTPPDWASFAWPVMETAGFVYGLMFTVLLFLLIMNAFDRVRPVFVRRFWQRLYVWTIPIPFLVVSCGWLVREVGRQPWLVHGELTVAEAVSPNSARTVLTSYLVITTVLVVLAVIDWWLIARLARRGPHRMILGSDGLGGDGPEGGPPGGDTDRPSGRSPGGDHLVLAGRD